TLLSALIAKYEMGELRDPEALRKAIGRITFVKVLLIDGDLDTQMVGGVAAGRLIRKFDTIDSALECFALWDFASRSPFATKQAVTMGRAEALACLKTASNAAASLEELLASSAGIPHDAWATRLKDMKDRLQKMIDKYERNELS